MSKFVFVENGKYYKGKIFVFVMEYLIVVL